MRKQRKGRIYEKDPKNGRLYGDFRNLGGKCEALIPKGEKRATTDWDVAGKRVAEIVRDLEEQKRGIAIIGRGREETLESYALHHLKRKEALKEVQRYSRRTTAAGARSRVFRQDDNAHSNRRESRTRLGRESARAEQRTSR